MDKGEIQSRLGDLPDGRLHGRILLNQHKVHRMLAVRRFPTAKLKVMSISWTPSMSCSVSHLQCRDVPLWRQHTPICGGGGLEGMIVTLDNHHQQV